MQKSQWEWQRLLVGAGCCCHVTKYWGYNHFCPCHFCVSLCKMFKGNKNQKCGLFYVKQGINQDRSELHFFSFELFCSFIVVSFLIFKEGYQEIGPYLYIIWSAISLKPLTGKVSITAHLVILQSCSEKTSAYLIWLMFNVVISLLSSDVNLRSTMRTLLFMCRPSVSL